jgi:hypothetical protein
MALRPSKIKQVEILTFDPTLFSVRENEFLLDTLGKPTIVAMDGATGVNPKAIRPILDRVNELEAFKSHNGSSWVGVDAMKETIRAYLRENAKWKRDKQRSRRAPRFPSMYSFDQKGRAHLGGIGSDSGKVRTYFDAAGNRVPFEIELIPSGVSDWVAPGFTEKPTSGGIKVDDAMNRIECLICGHTESFKGESRASYAAARARISKHLRSAKQNPDAHLEAHREEFS